MDSEDIKDNSKPKNSEHELEEEDFLKDDSRLESDASNWQNVDVLVEEDFLKDDSRLESDASNWQNANELVKEAFLNDDSSVEIPTSDESNANELKEEDFLRENFDIPDIDSYTTLSTPPSNKSNVPRWQDYFDVKGLEDRVSGKLNVNNSNNIKTTPSQEISVNETENNNDTHSESNTTPIESLKITMANNGTISYNGNTYNITTQTIRKGLSLNERRSNGEIIHDMPNIQKYINLVDKETPMDFTVILSIDSLNIPTQEKNKLIENYFINVLKSQYECKINKKIGPTSLEEEINNKYKYSDIEVIYDMKKLSKIPFFKTLFSKHPEEFNLLQEEKQQLAHLGNVSNRYGLGKTVGKYTDSIKSSILKLRSETKKLFPQKDAMKTLDSSSASSLYDSTSTERQAAELYDKAVFRNNKFRKDLLIKDAVKDKRIAKELLSLAEEQKKQNDDKKIQTIIDEELNKTGESVKSIMEEKEIE